MTVAEAIQKWTAHLGWSASTLGEVWKSSWDCWRCLAGKPRCSKNHHDSLDSEGSSACTHTFAATVRLGEDAELFGT